MFDITMCTGENCPLKSTCYRATAIPQSNYQSWMSPPVNEDGVCDMYLGQKE